MVAVALEPVWPLVFQNSSKSDPLYSPALNEIQTQFMFFKNKFC